MARPLRDFGTPTASAGDPTRAATRFSDGYEWISHGDDALVKAGAAIGDLIQNRVERAGELQDATSRAEGMNAVRLSLSERLRALDPRAPDYVSQVEAAIAEVSAATLERTNFRRDENRTRFTTELRGVAVEARLKAAAAHEAAVIDSARGAVDQAINTAVAQVATLPGSRDLALAQFEAAVGPVLSVVRPEVAEELRRRAAQVTAEEDVRAMLARRDFRGAEAALRTYGGAGLLSPTGVRQIRAGLESERRQAAAEARSRSREAALDISLAIQEGDLQGAREALDRAAQTGLLPADSPEHRRLGISLSRAEYRSRDRGAETIAATQLDLAVGRALTPERQAAFLAAQGLRHADTAERALPEDATPEQRQQAREQGMARGLEVGTSLMLAANPTTVPDILRDRMADSTNPVLPPDRRAEMIMDVLRHGLDVPAVQAALEANPGAVRAVTRLQALGQAITPQALAAELRATDGIDEATVRRNREEWRRQTTGRDATVNPTALLDAALRREFADAADRGAIAGVRRQQALGYMEAAAGWGATPEQAATEAAKWMRHRLPVSNAGTTPVQLPAEQAPISVLPLDLRRAYGDEVLSAAMRDKVLPIRDQVFGALGADYDISLYATRVATGETVIRAAARNRRDPAAQWRDLMVDEGRPWQYAVSGKTPAEIEQFFGLRELRDREINVQRGGSPVIPEDVPAIERRVEELRLERDRERLQARRPRAEQELREAEAAAQRTGGNWSAARIQAHQQRQRERAERLRREIEAIDRALAGGSDISP